MIDKKAKTNIKIYSIIYNIHYAAYNTVKYANRCRRLFVFGSYGDVREGFLDEMRDEIENERTKDQSSR